MIYVYDIILNWNDKEIYEFFEWELNDELEHIKKIPLLKVSTTLLDDMIHYDFKVEEEYLNKVKNLTESYGLKEMNVIPFASLFTDGTRVLAIEFNEDGLSIYKSKLLLDEEQDVLILSNKLLEYKMNIEKINQVKTEAFTTRFEKEVKKLLKIEINDSFKTGNFDKLKYLYYECFGKRDEDINFIYKKLIESVDKELNYHHNKLYEVLKLSYQNKS